MNMFETIVHDCKIIIEDLASEGKSSSEIEVIVLAFYHRDVINAAYLIINKDCQK